MSRGKNEKKYKAPFQNCQRKKDKKKKKNIFFSVEPISVLFRLQICRFPASEVHFSYESLRTIFTMKPIIWKKKSPLYERRGYHAPADPLSSNKPVGEMTKEIYYMFGIHLLHTNVRQMTGLNDPRLKSPNKLKPWRFLVYLGYKSSVSTCSGFSSGVLATVSVAVSSIWANMSAMRASSSLLLTLCTRSSCFLEDTQEGKERQLSAPMWQLYL